MYVMACETFKDVAADLPRFIQRGASAFNSALRMYFENMMTCVMPLRVCTARLGRERASPLLECGSAFPLVREVMALGVVVTAVWCSKVSGYIRCVPCWREGYASINSAVKATAAQTVTREAEEDWAGWL
jgi:hypothetical protein